MIYLASRSPRRLELLKQIGITEVRLLLDEDEGRAEDLEAIRPKESPTNYVERVARAKAEAAWQRLQELQRQDFLAQMAGSPVAEIAATTAPATAAAAGATSNGTAASDSPSATPATGASSATRPAPGRLPKGAAATGRNWPAAHGDRGVGGRILGKPTDEEDARRILKLLSGRSHRVLSSVVVVSPRGKVRQRTQVSRVRFRRLSDEDITAYIASGEPFGKAGAYGIQGLAARFVKKIEGSYSSIMGLPLYETAALLKKATAPAASKKKASD